MAMNSEDCGAETPLRPNAGKSSAIILSPALTVEPPRQVDLQFTDICYSVPDRKGKWKEILSGVSGEFRSGRLTAILGPSGAGKTSLLRLLAMRGSARRLRGTLRLNGATAAEQPELHRRLSICHVPQEFALIPLLTTRETIYLAARLKLSNATHDCEAREHIIHDVAKRLGLLDCLETLAGKLSGGERKRLSIAVEMITSPSVMLLDEPTSGLDSASSNQVINLLCMTALSGCTVICAVHQPSSQMTCRFDDLLIMSRGRSRYCGPRERVLDFFKEAGYEYPPFYNLAEFVLEVVSGERGGNYERMCSKDRVNDADSDFKYSICSTPSSADEFNTSFNSGRYAASPCEQIAVLIQRAFICISRDNTLTYLRLSAHLIVAVLLGVVFYGFGQDAAKLQSNIACIFFFPLFLFFANAMPAVQMFPPEAAVFLREKSNNWYSLEAYCITKWLTDLPMQVICPTGFLAIAYYMTGQPIDFMRYTEVWLICTLFAMLAQSFGMAIGAAFNTHAGMFLVPAFNIPMFLFAGFFLKLSEVPVYLRFLSFISYFRYVFEGMLQAIYLDRPKLPCSTDFCYLRDTKKILGELDMPSVPFCTTIFALVGWIVFLHTLIYGVLRYKLLVANVSPLPRINKETSANVTKTSSSAAAGGGARREGRRRGERGDDAPYLAPQHDSIELP